jgi:hypothetical protein
LEHADLKDLIIFAAVGADDCFAFFELSAHDVVKADYIFVVYEPAVDEEELEVVTG